ncbi:MAG: hypothetical protein K6E62_13305 [Lachnospiraceae bacterium]|nr:hypothetical protein [Lachnospiraceae bacterium]
MSLKYWDTMAERERLGNISAAPALTGALRRFGRETDKTLAKSEVTEELRSLNASSANRDKNGSLNGEDNPANNVDTSGNTEAQSDSHSNLPRPLALIFGTLLILVSTVGISILTAVVFLFAAVFAVVSAALIGGCIFVLFEAFCNIASAPIVSVESIGIGLAAAALGIIVFILAAKCGFELLPKVTGLYPKVIKKAVNL